MHGERLKSAAILIVDDQQPNVELLESFLADDGYTNYRSTTDSRRAVALFESFRPDLVLLDLHMPPPDGFEVMRQLKALVPEDSYLPVLVLTADTTPETKQRALSGGATDFLSKPLDLVEVQLRIRNLLETRLLHLQLQEQNVGLKGEVRAEREERLLALERVRTRIATDLHDDIGASLSQVAIMSEVARARLAADGAAAAAGDDDASPARVLAEIADTARDLLDSMSDIVWAVDPRLDDLRSVAQRIRQFASGVFRAAGVAWEFPAPSDDALAVPLDAGQRRHLLLIFKEAVNNVARHSGCSSARLSIEVRGDSLVGEISDDGCGLAGEGPERRQEESAARGGNGMRNMRARAEQLGGSLDIESGADGRTRLTLKVPLKSGGAHGREPV